MIFKFILIKSAVAKPSILPFLDAVFVSAHKESILKIIKYF